MTALRAASWYLPERTVAVADLPELAGMSGAERETCLALGIDRVPVDDSLTATDLGVRAARQVLVEAGISAAEVDVLIVVESRAPRALVASEATLPQALLGADRALSFTVGGLGCTSIVPGLLAARGLLAADPDLANVLVVHGSKPATPHRYRHPVTVNGDGGQAVLVARDGPVRIRDILVETSGKYWDLFRIDYRDLAWARWREECTDLPRYSFELAVETRNRLQSLLAQLLRRNGIRPGDVEHYVSQNLSAGAFRFYQEALDLKLADACSVNLRRYGHLGPNDALLNLYTAMGGGSGLAVVFNVSPAASWSAMLVEFGATTARSHHL
ncbi:3-oxoacyl-ACP synthase [Actinokineospora sp. NBRC 105648]|uniref:3-oxoacyl-ACP synthase n=1 Tax=Actinokineospora sp. NBRC 105648 TaxID=3032206 RepID=UPI0024A1ED37|nr:3-oxoacyl-ACP synthase [Actinokineospora sp. NBRC 105648]GLZ40294.1 3-oxoacyl-ACP synthase [Actinokineospora sp. NBRC 105648]